MSEIKVIRILVVEKEGTVRRNRHT